VFGYKTWCDLFYNYLGNCETDLHNKRKRVMIILSGRCAALNDLELVGHARKDQGRNW
jgi:hypothetical protein